MSDPQQVYGTRGRCNDVNLKNKCPDKIYSRPYTKNTAIIVVSVKDNYFR